MLFIVMGHLITQNGLVGGNTWNAICLYLLGLGSRVATNIFLIISCWFLLDRKPDGRRIVDLYLQLVFYSWLLTGVAVLLNRNAVVTKDIIRGLIPFTGRSLWFVSAYITMLLFLPFLNKILLWNEKTLKAFVVLLLFCTSLVSTLPDPQIAYVCDSMWFLIIYLTIGYYKKYCHRILKRKNLLLLGVSMYLALVIGASLPVIFGGRISAFVAEVCTQYLMDIKALPNILIAFFCFIFFEGTSFVSSVINQVSRFTFATYLFHQVPAFYPILWTILKGTLYSGRIENGILFVVIAVLIIYFIATVLEMVRTSFVVKLYENSKVYNTVVDRLSIVIAKWSE